MKWNATIFALTLMALGMDCIEDGYDPWQPASTPSRWMHPAGDLPPGAGGAADFPFDAAPVPKRR